MALPGCLAELRVNFLADFAAYFLKSQCPSEKNPRKNPRTTARALPA